MQQLKTLQRFTKQTNLFRQVLRKCGEHPGKKAVHHLRSEIARLEALLRFWIIRDNLRQTNTNPQHTAVRAGARQEAVIPLLKMRHGAGKVRDLDVQRRLVAELADSHTKGDPKADMEWRAMVEKIDIQLKRQRKKNSKRLTVQIGKKEESITADIARLVKFANEDMARDAPPVEPIFFAQSAFAEAVREFPGLGPGNLHDFRKRCRQARYLAEIADAPVTKGGRHNRSPIAEALKEIQDAIGAWHDTGLLLEQAKQSEQGKQPSAPVNALIRTIEDKRRTLYSSAIGVVERVRPCILRSRDSNTVAAELKVRSQRSTSRRDTSRKMRA